MIALLLAGCAATLHGTTDTLTLSSPEPGTVWEVNGAPVAQGRSAVYALPTKRNRGTVIRATAPGCEPASAAVSVRLDPATLLGILLDGGLVSVLIVDAAATGAWTRPVQTAYHLEPFCEE